MSNMFEKLTKKFTKYACDNEGLNLANLFAENGVYHDYIYGSFQNRKRIKTMISDYFHRDAESLFWDMYDHALQDGRGYAKYRFRFISKIPQFKGKEVIVPGFAFFKLKNGMIEEYSESVNGGLAMVQLGVNPLKIEKVFVKWLKRSLDEDKELKSLSNKISS